MDPENHRRNFFWIARESYFVYSYGSTNSVIAIQKFDKPTFEQNMDSISSLLNLEDKELNKVFDCINKDSVDTSPVLSYFRHDEMNDDSEEFRLTYEI